MEENSVNKSVVIFLLSICVISLCMGIYANYRLIVISKENQKIKEQEKKKEKVYGVEDEEKEITDGKVLELISKRQEVLKNYTSDQISNKKARIYEKDQNSKELIGENKLVAVLYTLFEDNSSAVELDTAKYPNTLILQPDLVKKLYKETFGEELDSSIKIPEDIKDSFYYSDEYGVYVINSGFGGACLDGSITYDYKYTEDSANVYIYSAHAYYKTCPYEVYKDFDKTEKYETDKIIRISENNYEDFYNYKITYKKDGNNYIFAKIEKIN